MSLTVNWVTQQSTFNTSGSNTHPKICIDSQGCSYVVYETTGITSGQIHVGAEDIVIMKLDRTGSVQWITQNSIFNTLYDETFPCLSIDHNDNLYVSYQTAGDISGHTSTSSSLDIVVMKIDTLSGNILWITQNPIINTSSDDVYPSITTDISGYVYIGYTILNDHVSGQTQTGTSDIVIIKLDPIQGSCLWVSQQKSFNSSGNNTLVSIVCDKSNNIYGTYQASSTVSGQTYSGGLSDIVLFKLEPTHGSCLWSIQQKSFNTSGTDQYCHLTIDNYDYLYVCYSAGGVASGQTYSGGTSDIVVIKFNSDHGQCLWVKEMPYFNTSGDDLMSCIAVNQQGYLYICYQTTGTASGQEYVGGSHDIVIFKIDPQKGDYIWTNQLPIFDTTLDDLNPSMVIDSAGQLYLTYQTNGHLSNTSTYGTIDVIVFCLIPPVPKLELYQYYGTLDLPDPSKDPAIVGTYIIYNYGIRNIGGLPVNNIMINDNMGTEHLSVGSLQPNESTMVDSRIYQLKQTDIDHGSVISQATADGNYYGDIATVYGETSVEIKQIAALSFIKHTISSDNFIGGFINYEFLVKNIGNMSFSNLRLVDPKIGIDFYRDSLEVADSWTENASLLITEEIFKEYNVKNVATLTCKDAIGTSHQYDAENITTLCVTKNTMITMNDGTVKPIQNIQRGDIVKGNHIVARLCITKINPKLTIELMIIGTNTIGSNQPNQPLIITTNHPIIYNNMRYPAQCFINFRRIKKTKVNGIDTLYDLQFDHDGTYFANNVEIQSCSPHSEFQPLQRELYFDKSKYTDELVWDSFEQALPMNNHIIQTTHKKHK